MFCRPACGQRSGQEVRLTVVPVPEPEIYPPMTVGLLLNRVLGIGT